MQMAMTMYIARQQGGAIFAAPPGTPEGASAFLDFQGGRYWVQGRRYSEPGIPGRSFTRAGTRAGTRQDGSLQLFGPNVPRITDRGLSNWPGATNMLLHSGDAMQWTNISVTRTDLGLSDFAGARRVRVAGTGGAANRVAVRDRTLTNGEPYRVKIWYEAGTSGRAGVRLRSVAANQFSTVAGLIGSLSATATAGGTITNLSEGVQTGSIRFIAFTFTPNLTASDWEIGFGPDSTVTGENIVYLAGQLEAGTVDTPYIPAGASSGTAGADVYYLEDLAALGLTDAVIGSSYTVVVQWRRADTLEFFPRPWAMGTAANNADDFTHRHTNGAISVRAVRASTTSESGGTAPFNATNKLALSVSGGESRASLNGEAVVTQAGWPAFTTLTDIYMALGSSIVGGQSLTGEIERIIIIPEARSGAALQGLSA